MFLWVFSSLTVCSIIIYGIIIAVVPQRYQISSDTRLEGNVQVLFEELNGNTYENAYEKIYNFCIENNTIAMLQNDEKTITFGNFENIGEEFDTSGSYTTSVKFQDSTGECTLSVISISEAANDFFYVLLKFIPILFLVIVSISGLSSYFCSKIIVTPISKISRISRKMTELDMTWQCDDQRSDEIGVLARSLNIMAGKLKEMLEELENANIQLKNDVIRFQQLEQQHRDFFTAVSHELKTPLTILKGQIENMILGFGDYQNHEKYLPQALKTTEEIEYLVKEILTVTKMENVSIENSVEEVCLKTMIQQIVLDIGPLLEKRKIRVWEEIPENLIIRVNEKMFKKALSNIIGNAVRYSPEGEEVFITINKKNILVIENTGVFLKQNELEHMFLPFYRTDQSRNKATGGSGLGLYIVKTILDIHKMKYSIDNTKRGVAFCLHF